MDVKPIKQVVYTGASERPTGEVSRNTPISSDSSGKSGGDKVSISESAMRQSAVAEEASIGQRLQGGPGSRVGGVEAGEKESGTRTATQQFFTDSKNRVESRSGEWRAVASAAGEIQRQDLVNEEITQRVVDREIVELEEAIVSAAREAGAVLTTQKVEQQRDRSLREEEGFLTRRGGGRFRRDLGVEIVTGPDGHQRLIAAGMEVEGRPTQTSPDAVVRKMAEVRRQALASLDPTPHERAVALRAAMVENKARQQLNETRAEIHRNDIGIGADAATVVLDTARAHAAPHKPTEVDRESDAKVVEQSEMPGSIGSSDGETRETPLLPLLDPLKTYQKNVEAMSEVEEGLKGVLG